MLLIAHYDLNNVFKYFNPHFTIIYIHCYEGVNRSAATVVYYLHLKYGWQLERKLIYINKH